MPDKTATFETGVSGNTIATSDAGSLTAWDIIGGTPLYDNSRAAHGAMSAKLSANSDFCRWNLGNPTDHYGRIYLYETANPTSSVSIIRVVNVATVVASIKISSGGLVVINDTADLNGLLSTNAIALNKWVRIEYHVVHSATVGQIEIKLFNNTDSSTPTETLTGPASWDTGAVATSIRQGWTAGATSSPFWMDDIVAEATNYPGPVVTQSDVQLVMGMLGTGRV